MLLDEPPLELFGGESLAPHEIHKVALARSHAVHGLREAGQGSSGNAQQAVFIAVQQVARLELDPRIWIGTPTRTIRKLA